jgi:hypothetical protein
MNHKDTSKDRLKKITQQEVTWEYSALGSAREDNKRRHQFFRFIFIQFSCDLYWIFPSQHLSRMFMQKGIVFLSMEYFNKDYTIIFLLFSLIEFKWFWVERRWKNGRLSSRKEMIFFMCHMKVFHHLRGVTFSLMHI